VVAIDPRFSNLHILDHPLIVHKLSHMRDKGTSTRNFRQLLKEISLLMGYEITRHLPMTEKEIETPVCTMSGQILKGKKAAIVPILRAGLGMADGLLELMPSARVGHIGMYRDSETKRPVEYLRKLPSAAGRSFILVDPMLATGYSAVAGVNVLLDHGVTEEQISFMALVAAPEGVQVMLDNHPGIKVYVAGLDEKLNEQAYIVPGLGDAGDRLYGTV
jgi:uracil phosphoribosyltransferase